MAGLLGDIGNGLISAGAALNPQVMQGMQREQQMRQEQQFAQAQQMVRNVIQGVQSGAIPAEQGRAVLQKMGIDLPVGPDTQTQQAQQQQQLNQQAMQWMQQRQQQASPEGGGGVGLGLGASLRDIPSHLLGAAPIQNAIKLQDTLATHENLRQTRDQQQQVRTETLQQRQIEADQRAENQRLTREDREQARQESMALRRELAAGRTDLMREMQANRLSARTGNANPGENVPGDWTKSGDDFLKSLPVTDQQFVKKLASYEIDPKTLSTRGEQRERYLKMATQYNPDFDQKNYNTISQAVNKFATGQQGNTVRSLNVAIEHMDTARKLGDALKNNDLPLFNKVANEFSTQTGKPAPTNFDAVKEIVADEVVKGVIGGAGALADREAAAKKIKNSSSPAQLNGVLNSWTELLGGQIKGLEKQYEGATSRKDFREKYMTPRTLEAIGDKPSSGKTVLKFDAQGNLLR